MQSYILMGILLTITSLLSGMSDEAKMRAEREGAYWDALIGTPNFPGYIRGRAWRDERQAREERLRALESVYQTPKEKAAQRRAEDEVARIERLKAYETAWSAGQLRGWPQRMSDEAKMRAEREGAYWDALIGTPNFPGYTRGRAWRDERKAREERLRAFESHYQTQKSR